MFPAEQENIHDKQQAEQSGHGQLEAAGQVAIRGAGHDGFEDGSDADTSETTETSETSEVEVGAGSES